MSTVLCAQTMKCSYTCIQFHPNTTLTGRCKDFAPTREDYSSAVLATATRCETKISANPVN
uniref:Uncharacterized protein n=1 Tax=Physcomitrium patens TaxID=3218 RepID=A0A2K1K6Y5_PHYPA|nr:hypothetical protein PHYPA_011435 [Physcomitrium patens]